MLEKKVLGRAAEIKLLDRIWASKEAEFLALYGRRRVGKTYLIREYFKVKKCLFFEISGQKDGSLTTQLENFTTIFSKLFYNDLPLKAPSSWKEALNLLTKQIEQLPKKQRIVIFFDELPWLAGLKSQLLQAIDYTWNRFWSSYPNLIFIVCGSAASWMLDHLINAKGGLHNRLTKTMLLKPYNLADTKQFLAHYGIKLNNKQVLDLYMAFGGVPYYLKQIEKGKSALQLINKICFAPDGLLYDEFERLFHSLFAKAEDSLLIIRALAKSQKGLSREELIKSTKLASGGTLNKRLEELEAAGFIQTYIPYNKKIKGRFCRIIDEYCLFYLRFIEPFKQKLPGVGHDYWSSKGKTQTALAWAGYAFEGVCFKHIAQIQKVLGLQTIAHELGSWRYSPAKKSDHSGAQIDLLFDREDGVITLCEIKYSENPYLLDKAEAKNLLNKIEVFEAKTATTKQIQLVLLTSCGIKKNMWVEELISHVITLDDLM